MNRHVAEHAHVSFPAEGVGLLLIDNPPLNFGSYALLADLKAGLERIISARASVVVLASDVPGYFMAHAWLPDVIATYSDPAKVSGDPRGWREVAHLLERGPLVSIAANHGQAWGGGAELSWACNLRTASPEATYGQLEIVLGLIPGGGGTFRPGRLAGQATAMELVLDGEPITGTEAKYRGLVNRVFEAASLRDETVAWAARIASRPRRALQAAKRSVLQTWDMHYEDARRLETAQFDGTVTPETLTQLKQAQAIYDAGGDSWTVIGRTRPESEPAAASHDGRAAEGRRPGGS